VEAVVGEGARLRVPAGGGGGRSLELLAGVAWFDPGGPAAAAGVSPPPFLLRAGGVEVEDRGATFAVERRASGAVSVTVEAGRVAVRSGGREVAASGPSRVDASPGGEPGEAHPAEPSDATAWFAFPEVRAAIAEGTGEGRDLVVTLLPSVPRAIRIAPWDRADPLFTVRAEPPDGSAVLLPVRPRMLRRKPPDPDPDGGFLLKPGRPYRMVLDPAALGLRPGTYRVQVLYSASRPGGGLWRGTRPSNTLELVVP
jgi:hypothetical protein